MSLSICLVCTRPMRRAPSEAYAFRLSVRKVSEDAAINDVVELMSNAQIRRVPVVNKNDQLVGIVSLADLATNGGTKTGQVGKTVEEISEGPGNN